jgi:putative FmdB family regulatory protein
MPTYEYQCKTCGQHFEKMQRFSDNPLTECPNCGGEIRRVIHPAGVIFKGSGWYITDSRKSSSAAVNADGAKKDGDAAAKEGKPAESTAAESKTTESKPAEKTAAST